MDRERPSRVSRADAKTSWKDIRCASLRVGDLPVLADLRGRAEIGVLVEGERAWVWWQAGAEVVPDLVARRILPAEGVELFTERGGQWYRLGEHLPAFGVPFRDGAIGVPLDRVVIPDRLSVLRPGELVGEPMRIRLVREEGKAVRPATALRCALAVLGDWAEAATTAQLTPLQGAWRKASDGEEEDDEVLVVGPPGALPLLHESVRYWGTGLWIPLGFRAEPELPERAIRGAAGAGEGDLAILDESGFELIDRAAFEPLTRAGVRLARGGPGGARPDGRSRG
jgi:hypothetical protein